MTRKITQIIAGTAAALAIGGVGLLAPATAEASSQANGVVKVDDLQVRRAPTTHSNAITTVDQGTKLELRCIAMGPKVRGNSFWFAVGPDVGKWVAATYVDAKGIVPQCGSEEGPGETVDGTITAEPVLNSFSGPSLKDSSVNEYAPGDRAKVVCQVEQRKSSGDTTWYLSSAGDWLTAEHVALPKGTDLRIC